MDKKVLYQGCPTLAIKDIEDSKVVGSVIAASMERRRFVIKDEKDSELCLVRFVKQEKSGDCLPNYEIRVYNKDYKVMFTKETISKKWDSNLESYAKDMVADIAHLHKLVSLKKQEDIQRQFEALVLKCVADSVDKVKKATESDIDSSLSMEDWYCTPSESDLADSDLKWYYEVYKGEDKIKEGVKMKLAPFGFKVADSLQFTPNGVMEFLGDAMYDCCIDKAMGAIFEQIDSLDSIDSVNDLTDSYFKQDWGRLAIERMGGKTKVINELIKPKVKDIAESEIQSIKGEISELEKQIAEYQASIDKYQVYLS